MVPATERITVKAVPETAVTITASVEAVVLAIANIEPTGMFVAEVTAKKEVPEVVPALRVVDGGLLTGHDVMPTLTEDTVPWVPVLKTANFNSEITAVPLVAVKLKTL